MDLRFPRALPLLCLLAGLLLSRSGLAAPFTIADYPAYALMGEAHLVEGTEYVSFSGDFGFAGWAPAPETIERHLAHEAPLLAHFHLRVSNLEHLLPGVSGDALDRQIDAVALDLLKRAGFDVVSLANNHAMDYGLAGVRYNLSQWPEVGLATIGTHDSPVYMWETGGRRVAIFSATDTLDRADPDGLVLRLDRRDVALLGQKTARADFRIAFVHLGSMSVFPSPHERKQVNRLLDAGADLVVCTGSHFIKGFVIERGKPVAYGIGNHLFLSSSRITEPIGMHLVAGFRAGELVQLFVVPFRNMIVEEDTGPLDAAAFEAFTTSLRERSTTDATQYFADPKALTLLQDRLSRISLSTLGQLRSRHFGYAIMIIFHHHPVVVVVAGLIVLLLPVLLIRRRVLMRRQATS